jgi:lipoate-protein ligase A
VRADEGEITVNGRKLVGSALLRQDGALLQHGSILLDDDQAILEQLLPGEAPPLAAGTLRQALENVPTVSAVADALFGALLDGGVRDASPLDDDSRLQGDAAALEHLYGSDAWTYRQ